MNSNKETKHIDMLSGSLWEKILIFAVPLVLIGIIEQLFNAADVAVVGRFSGENGKNAMAAVGATSSIIGLIVYTFIAVSLGTNVVIAHAYGASDSSMIKKCVHTSALSSIIIGTLLTIFAEAFAVPIFKTQDIPSDVFDMTIKYFRIYSLGIPLILLYNFLASIYRGVGNTKTPLIVLIISGVLNLCLNLIFVLGLDLDVEGVALATVISNAISALVLFIMLLFNKEDYGIRIKELKISGKALIMILQIGIPAGIQSAVFCIANIIIQTKINSLGNTIMAASSAAYNVEAIVSYVFAGFSQAATTFVGQNYGAGDIKRCKATLSVSLIEGAIALGITDLLIFAFGRPIIGLFNSDSDVIYYGYIRLLYICSSFMFTLIYEVIAGYLRGFGISFMPSILTTIGICGVRIVWIYTMFTRHKTFKVILMAYPISLFITALLLFILLLINHPAKKYENENCEL